VLHLHQVAQGTFTPKLPDMSDTQDERPPILPNVKRAQERASFFAFSFDKIGSTVRRLWRSLRDP
jgi:hypothetical protein